MSLREKASIFYYKKKMSEGTREKVVEGQVLDFPLEDFFVNILQE